MLLTITYEGENTRNLGFLLYKHPDRAQQFDLSYGKAYVFYPEVSDHRTTAALLLDIDPIVLARGKLGSNVGGLFDYVNDRPYASTSFMSTALAKVFGTAMKGKNDTLPELADTPLNLTARLTSLKDYKNETLAEELFSPLGYTVSTKRVPLDEHFPEWGMSPYIELTLHGTVRLSELLNHLYVLIPVFDRQKHYYSTADELEKLLSHGEGWLATHPCKERIAYRYLASKKGLAQKAIDTLLLNDEEAEDTAKEESEPHTPLNTLRMNAVKDAVLKSNAASVIDLGCGSGRLTSLLLAEPQIKKLTACDISAKALEKAASRLKPDRLSEADCQKLTLMLGSLTYRDERFSGYDCACVIEVIEHIEPLRLNALERSLFEFASPKTVILTTPNKEYNAKYEMSEDKLRHSDHRFEWTRAEFHAWTKAVCEKFGYTCEISGIGENDAELGAPTQMGVFTKNG